MAHSIIGPSQKFTATEMAASARKQDDNGYLVVKACPITSYGIFDYGAGQLGLPGDPNRIVKVFRPPEAVSDPAAIESFKDIPLINDHEMLSGFQGDESATAPEEYGVGGVLTNNVYYADPWMRGDLKFFSRDMQQALTSGKKDLSLGYSCDFHLKAGSWNGQQYEVVQTNMRGNHIALVDEGRVPGARVLDARILDHASVDSDGEPIEVFSVEFAELIQTVVTDGEPDMALKKGKKAAMDNAVQQLKALLPALEQFLNEEAKEPEHQDAGATGGAGGEAGSEAAPVTPDASASSEGSAAGEGGEGGSATPEHTEAAASGAAEGAAEGATAAGGEGGAEGGTEGGEGAAAGGEADISALVAQAKAVLAKVEAALTGGQVGQDDGEGDNGGAIDSTQGLQEVNQGEGGQVCADGEGAGATEGNGRASAGPAAGVHATAGDAALQRFYADLDAKTRLYDRVSKVVGAFDCRAMDARQVAAYGVKKFNLKASDGAEITTLTAYLDGRDAAKVQNQQLVQKSAADTAAVVSEMDAYLNGAK